MSHIIHGSFNQDVCSGVVADACPHCGIQPFTLTNHHRVSLIFCLPAGNGSVQATTRKCQKCGEEFECGASDYENIIPAYAARVLPLEEIVARSNPRLSRGGWTAPSPLREFAVSLPPRAPKGAGCLPTLLICVPMGAVLALVGQVGVPLMSQGAVKEAAGAILGPLALPMLIGPFFLWRWLARRTYRGWFREEVIDPAAFRGMEPREVLALLEEMKKSSPPEGREKDLFDQLGILEQMLHT